MSHNDFTKAALKTSNFPIEKYGRVYFPLKDLLSLNKKDSVTVVKHGVYKSFKDLKH